MTLYPPGPGERRRQFSDHARDVLKRIADAIDGLDLAEDCKVLGITLDRGRVNRGSMSLEVRPFSGEAGKTVR